MQPVFVAAWAALVVLATLGQLLSGTTEQAGFLWAYNAFYWLFWVLVTPWIHRLTRRTPFERGRIGRALWLHGANALVIAALHNLVTFVVVVVGVERMRTLAADAGWATLYVETLGNRLATLVLAYGAIVCVGQLVEDRHRLRERALRAVELQADLAEAELRALKMRMHPHFLFNALHAVAVLIPCDPDAATATLEKIGDFLRHSLNRMSGDMVQLKEELEFVQLYLDIESIRFGARLKTRIDAAPETLHARVPPFVLQPLVENAVRHGIERRPAGGHVRVEATASDGRLTLRVQNDGVGLTDANGGPGLGLALTRERLARIYGAAHSLKVEETEGGGVTAVLVLPFATDGGA